MDKNTDKINNTIKHIESDWRGLTPPAEAIFGRTDAPATASHVPAHKGGMGSCWGTGATRTRDKTAFQEPHALRYNAYDAPSTPNTPKAPRAAHTMHHDA